ncbi:DUF3618 domain-containing protein [Amycolatopsis keratiniphila]|uniref:DUF3618 domain-containing protein n=1 Tax=Amycolatopsis keratiniphila TaxID=129921 RepID=UPI00087B6D58|nr:DUF3618 domain-containing protein [Amycolatopsis keratiniphila]OLZ58302.1 hypothetical protein BS330_12040 [Amycolatopsis keratiniphila subsp. nogabecina]SDU28768.1 Protein of unknown function [Amycolatopsis keratiniphila]
MTDFPKNAEEARADRDVTREELTETLDALGKKLDVKTRVNDNLDAKVDQASAKISDKVSEPAAEKFRQGTEIVRANPVPIFAGVLALLVTIRLILRKRSAS